MGHQQDFWEPLRTRLLPAIGVVASLVEDILGKEYYRVSHQRRNEFVGKIEMDEESFEVILHDDGYERNPLAWLKKRARTGEVEEGSWRKKIGDRQIHLVLYDGASAPNVSDDALFLYAHEEYAWDEHPIKHLRATEVHPDKGVRAVRKLLQDNGIDYEYVQPG